MDLKDLSRKINLSRVGYLGLALAVLLLGYYAYLEWSNKVERDISVQINRLVLQENKLDSEDKAGLEDIKAKYVQLYEQHPTRLNGVRAFFLASSLDMREKNYSESSKKLLKIIESNPDHYLIPQAYVNLAIISEISGDYSEALAYLKEFKEKYPEHYLKNEATIAEGRVYTKLEDYQLAKNFFDEVVANKGDGGSEQAAQRKIDFLTIKGLITNQ